MNEQDELLLLEQIRKHDLNALAVYIEQNRNQLIGFIRSITGTRATIASHGARGRSGAR